MNYHAIYGNILLTFYLWYGIGIPFNKGFVKDLEDKLTSVTHSVPK